MGDAAYKLVQENRGAVALTMELVANALKNKHLNEELQVRKYERILEQNVLSQEENAA